MHCAACSLTVEAALAQLPGVDGVRVNGASATRAFGLVAAAQPALAIGWPH